MPQRLFRLDDLRDYGLTAGDIRVQRRELHEVWPLPQQVVKIIKELLSRTGFDTRLPIHVHEVPEAGGFMFTQ